MKRWSGIILASTLSLAGCGSVIDEPERAVKERKEMAVVLSDVGLGDQSFSDAAMSGMALLREKEGWSIDYRELNETKTYKAAFEALAKKKPTVIVGLGFMGQTDLETVAKKYPKQQFALIDAVSTLPNVLSVTFKEDEGSYLAGAAAGIQTKTNTIGFVGGMKSPLIEKFEKGYIAGAKAVNPKTKVLIEYAEDFAAPEKGRTLANEMIQKKADVLFAAAGLTGSGVLEAAQTKGKKAIGVDSDQTPIAPDAVMTSMLKQVDLAITKIGQDVASKGLQAGQVVLGVKEGAIQLAPIRNTNFTDGERKKLEQLQQDVLEGKVTIQ